MLSLQHTRCLYFSLLGRESGMCRGCFGALQGGHYVSGFDTGDRALMEAAWLASESDSELRELLVVLGKGIVLDHEDPTPMPKAAIYDDPDALHAYLIGHSPPGAG